MRNINSSCCVSLVAGHQDLLFFIAVTLCLIINSYAKFGAVTPPPGVRVHWLLPTFLPTADAFKKDLRYFKLCLQPLLFCFMSTYKVIFGTEIADNRNKVRVRSV